MSMIADQLSQTQLFRKSQLISRSKTITKLNNHELTLNNNLFIKLKKCDIYIYSYVC